MEINQQGSEYDRLFYPFLFAGGQVSTGEVLDQVRHSTLEKCREVVELRRALFEQSREQIAAAGQAMAQAFAHGATLFAFGNGGSATDAQDLVADLMAPLHRCGYTGAAQSKIQNRAQGAPAKTPRALPAIALTNAIAVVTAVGNDVGFDNVFSRQLIAFGRPGDIAFGISTSGNSTNVLMAFQQAKKQGLLTVGLAGYDGGEMAHSQTVDYCITVHSTHIPRIQEAQATVYHALVDVVQALFVSR